MIILEDLEKQYSTATPSNSCKMVQESMYDPSIDDEVNYDSNDRALEQIPRKISI
jgi:hypothetical protein